MYILYVHQSAKPTAKQGGIRRGSLPLEDPDRTQRQPPSPAESSNTMKCISRVRKLASSSGLREISQVASSWKSGAWPYSILVTGGGQMRVYDVSAGRKAILQGRISGFHAAWFASCQLFYVVRMFSRSYSLGGVWVAVAREAVVYIWAALAHCVARWWHQVAACNHNHLDVG